MCNNPSHSYYIHDVVSPYWATTHTYILFMLTGRIYGFIICALCLIVLPLQWISLQGSIIINLFISGGIGRHCSWTCFVQLCVFLSGFMCKYILCVCLFHIIGFKGLNFTLFVTSWGFYSERKRANTRLNVREEGNKHRKDGGGEGLELLFAPYKTQDRNLTVRSARNIILFSKYSRTKCELLHCYIHVSLHCLF